MEAQKHPQSTFRLEEGTWGSDEKTGMMQDDVPATGGESDDNAQSAAGVDQQQETFDEIPPNEAGVQLQNDLEDILSELETLKENHHSRIVEAFNSFGEIEQDMHFLIEDEARETDEYLHLAQEREKQMEEELKRVRDTRARMKKRVRN